MLLRGITSSLSGVFVVFMTLLGCPEGLRLPQGGLATCLGLTVYLVDRDALPCIAVRTLGKLEVGVCDASRTSCLKGA